MGADGLNRWQGFGNLGRDSELKATSGGSVLNFSVACQDSYLDRNKVRQERTEWVNCCLFGRRAEALAKYLVKGTKVYLEGALRTSSWEKDGVKRYSTKINIDKVILAGGGRAASTGGGGRGEWEDKGNDPDSAVAKSGSDDPGPGPDAGTTDYSDDDIPF